MPKILKKILCGLTLFLFLVVPTIGHAQGLKDAVGKVKPIGAAAGEEGEITNITGTIIKGALGAVGLVFFLLMVYAGYLWMTARGESDQVEQAKKILAESIIGLVIIVSAYAMTVFITKQLGG